jgi:GNAT superfamily N-acetyltransferase
MLLRLATAGDATELAALIERSVRELQRDDYNETQIELALRTVYGVDTALIRDGTYFAVIDGERIVGCGGWSRRKTLYGGDDWTGREDETLDPRTDAAKIRAFFVHPAYVRRGIATMILKACEDAAREAGFRRLEMGATITGIAFYEAQGYKQTERVDAPLPDGNSLPVIRMIKTMPLSAGSH